MAAPVSAPRRGGSPPAAAPRGVPRRRAPTPARKKAADGRSAGARKPREAARELPRPRSSALGRLLRGVSLLLAVALLLGLAAGAGSLQVLQSSRTAEAGYELRSLQAERAELGARLRLIEAEIAHLADLDAVYTDATTRLGMAPSDRTLNVAVGVPAPEVIPMPERYVQDVAPLPAAPVPWWEHLFGSVTGLN